MGIAATRSLPKVLCLDGEHGLLTALRRALEGRFEVVGADDLGEALAEIEGGGDFPVAVVALDRVATGGLVFLEILGEKSPTTARIAVSQRAFVDLSSLAPVTLFRLLHSASSDETFLYAALDALNYHSLLARCALQPVEPSADDEPSIEASSSELTQPELEPRAWLERRRVGVRLEDRTIELLPGTTTLGRSRTCHVPIRDPRVSRRHASLMYTAAGLSIQNTSQTSGVWVNGQLLGRERVRALGVGDRVTLGRTTLELCALGDYSPSLEPTRLARRERAPSSLDEPATFAMTAALVEKCAALGRLAEAERILRPTMEGLLRHCSAGGDTLPEDVDLAVSLSLRLAARGRAGLWIDYVFELFGALARPMPLELVERLQRLIPQTRGARVSRFRAYLARLKEREDQLTPTERYLVRRVQALEVALMMSAHA